METPKLFQYAIILHPTCKEIEDSSKESEVLVEPTTILAKGEKEASMIAAMSIDPKYKKLLSQIEIVLRPF